MLDIMELTDTHTHTFYSGHGDGYPSDLVKEALAKGLSTLAITEHLTLPSQMDARGDFSMLPEQVKTYRQQVARAAADVAETAAAKDTAPLEVICGVEVDWFFNCESYLLEQLGFAGNTSSSTAYRRSSGHYQLLLGSVHMLSGENPNNPYDYWPLDYIDTIDGWYERGERYVWDNYVQLWLDAVGSSVPFDIMSHPDLPKKLGFKPDFDATPLWQQMAEAAAAKGVMIELNTSGLFNTCQEVYPGPELLSEFRRAGVPCTISSDAHTPANVSRAHTQAVLALLEAGYTKITVPTVSGDRREIALS
jgi:histidinol-phosphatase (PHP family)